MPSLHVSYCLSNVLLVGCDDDVAFGLAVVAHALHSVDLGQLVDDLPVFSVHGRETVASLCLFSLQTAVMCLLGRYAENASLIYFLLPSPDISRDIKIK